MAKQIIDAAQLGPHVRHLKGGRLHDEPTASVFGLHHGRTGRPYGALPAWIGPAEAESYTTVANGRTDVVRAGVGEILVRTVPGDPSSFSEYDVFEFKA